MPRFNSSALRRAVDIPTFLLGLGMLLLLLFEFGFPLQPPTRRWILLVVRVNLWTVAVLQLAGAIMAFDRLRAGRRGMLNIAGFAVLVLTLAFEPVAVRWLDATSGAWETMSPTAAFLTGLQVVMLLVLARRLLELNQVLAFVRVSPRTILVSSFVGLIAVGTALLKLPNATTVPVGWLDALFTSTSAVCVTGLIVVDTASVFTPFGQSVILLLFQLGGLGLMTFAYFFVALFGSGITIKDRALLLEFLNEEYVGRVTGSLVAIVVLTLVFELGGAFLLNTFLPGDWFASVFHAVSAFCNAGFSVYTAGLYDPLTRSNVPYQCVIMALIVLGGLGFPVLKNVWDHVWARISQPHRQPPRWTTHSKVVLATTAALITGGAVLIFVFEIPAAPRPDEAPSWFAALFSSITSRTAGFNAVPIDALLPPTVFIIILLMFVGGSPASTAGGIKTTTFAVALLNTIRILKDPNGDLVAFRRHVPAIVANRAFAVSLLALAWIAGTSVVLAWVMPDHRPLDIVFEAVSAFSTVGLSRGLTADLPDVGKALIVASMLVGRIGILYAALGILGRERPGRIGYPEGNIIIS